jgi:hypothetical protein
MLGLNSKGQPRRRRPNIVDSELAEHYRLANLAKYHRRARRLTAAGLTTRGTERRKAIIGYAWRQFRASIDVSTPALI